MDLTGAGKEIRESLANVDRAIDLNEAKVAALLDEWRLLAADLRGLVALAKGAIGVLLPKRSE